MSITRTRYGVSPWVDQLPASRRPDYSRLRGAQTAEVVVIGAGLAGCATAYACAVAGIKTIVLEADRVGQGSAARGAGLLLPEPGPAFRDVEQRHGLRVARVAFDGWRRAALEAAALLRRLHIRCGLASLDSLIVASGGDEKALRREFDARVKATLDASWMSPPKLYNAATPAAPGGIRMRDAFSLDPYRACLGLAVAAASRGALFFERSGVRSVKAGRAHVDVVAETGTVRASTVVVTTGTPGVEFASLRRHFKRRERYLVLTEPMPAQVRRQIGSRDLTFSDTQTPPHRVRWMPDDRILVSGAEQGETSERKRAAVLVQRTGQLMYELLTMFPMISGLVPEYGWEIVSGETTDALMRVGPHRNFPHHLFALGGGGDSVTGAFLAARIILRALRGTPDKTDAVWGFTR